jgi:hypothetical protein
MSRETIPDDVDPHRRRRRLFHRVPTAIPLARAVIGLLGKVLNDTLGDPVWSFVPVGRGILATSGPAGPVLTLQGVLAVYVPLLLMVLWVGQRR